MVLREDPWMMRVPRETNLPVHVGGSRKDFIHLLSVLKVLFEDVLAGWIAPRPVHKEEVPFLVLLGEASNEIPELPIFLLRLGLEAQLLPSPIDGHLRLGVESDRAEKDGFFVIAEEVDRKLLRELNARPRVWPIANNVPQTVNLLDPLVPDMLQNGFEGGQVTVNIGDNSTPKQTSLLQRRLSLEIPKIQNNRDLRLKN